MVLIGYWPLNETSGSTAYDRSGQNNHGNLKNGVTQGTKGILNTNAYSFDGSSTRVQIDGASSLFNAPLTITQWVNREDSSNAVSFAHDSRRHTLGYNFRNSNGFEFALYDGSDFQSVTSGITDKKWHFLVGTWNGSKMKFFVDGALQGSTSISNIDETYSTTAIGSDANTNNNVWSGKISITRLYSHVLTQREIQYLYEVSQRGRIVSGKRNI